MSETEFSSHFVRFSFFKTLSLKKLALGEALAVVSWNQNFRPPQTPSRGRGTAKIWSAGDGHYLYLQTLFSEDRCTQFRVIMSTDPQTNTN